jgi:hypothetical protein
MTLLEQRIALRGDALRSVFHNERPISDAAAIARKTDSEPPLVECPYCLTFQPSDPRHEGRSSRLCAPCQAFVGAQLDAAEACA